jgi:hypothetical protein
MKSPASISRIFLVLIFLSMPVLAQTSVGRVVNFSKSGLSFDYPAQMTLEDESTPTTQHLILKQGNGVQIMIMARYDRIASEDQLANARRDIVDPFTETMWQELRRMDPKLTKTTVQTEIAGRQATAGSSAWAMIRNTLRIESPTAQSNSPGESVVPSLRDVLQAGSVQESTYSNSLLGLSVTIPGGWEVQDAYIREMLLQKGKDLIKTDATNQVAMDTSVSNTANLLTLFETPASPSYRASFITAVERLPNGTYTTARYLTDIKTWLTKSSSTITYVLEKDIHTEMVGGAPFGAIDFAVNQQTGKSYQKYYAYVRNGYAVSFVLTYQSDGQHAALLKILEAVTMK